ncbi:type II toxin-antitoxin system YoeB family toxin [Limosilactobacillus reuteri]|uniref:type II toxin-antitoxin system YoeB family toxin n=1 Tax=Limosilactobacillus reuteri TaxID=1598 RepID=UPI000A3694C5|nr:type II toxin-antitoxin system YoeB family toxin [Limosilactobacillus reuteri]
MCTICSNLGKPEPLQHNLSGFWSRKLNSEYRMAYGVTSKEIQIIQLKYHSL